MSKATEWAKKLQTIAAENPAFCFQDDVPIAGVVVTPKSVGLQLQAVDLTPEDALRLAHWILETFGESEPAVQTADHIFIAASMDTSSCRVTIGPDRLCGRPLSEHPG